MSENKLKDRFPFLKDIDFENKNTRRNFFMIFLMLIMTIIVLCLAYASKRKSGLAVEGAERTEMPSRRSEVPDLPQGEDRDDIESENMITIRERGRSGRLADLYESFSGNDNDPMAIRDDNSDREALSEREDAERMFPGRTVGGPGTVGQQAQQPSGTTTASAQAQTKKINRGGTPSAGQKQSQSSGKKKGSQTSDTDKEEEQKPVTMRKSGGISSLDDSWGNIEGLSSLETDNQYIEFDEEQPIKVMFLRDAKISSGQRVTLRLLDDIVAGGVVIPRNTHLSAICTIGERLELTVQNIEVNDKIIKLGYKAFDNDGNEGLYCPESSAKKKAKQVTDEAMNIGQSALTTALSGMGLASQVARTGTSLIRSNTGTVSAQITAGYEFYLLKENN